MSNRSTQAPTNKDDKIELVQQYYQKVWSQGNLEIVDELIHPGYSPDSVLMPESGPALIRKEVTYFRSVFSGVDYTILDMVAQNDNVWVRYKYSGVHTGHAWGFEATGKRFEVEAAAILTLKDGKIYDYWGSYCFYDLFHSLELVPPWWELADFVRQEHSEEGIS